MVAAALCSSMPVWSAEPPSAPTAAAPATTTVADSAKPAAAAESVAAAAKAAAASTESKAENGRTATVPAGYKARIVDGETRYCRKSTPMGTRFPTEVCMTAAQYADSIRNQNALRQELTDKQKSYSINN